MFLLISGHSTPLCSRSLLSSAIGCSLHAPAPRLALQVPHFQVPWVYKVPFCSPNYSVYTLPPPRNTSQDLTLLPAAYYNWTPISVRKSLSSSASKCTGDLLSQLSHKLDAHSQFASNAQTVLANAFVTCCCSYLKTGRPFPVRKSSLSSTHKCACDFPGC